MSVEPRRYAIRILMNNRPAQRVDSALNVRLVVPFDLGDSRDIEVRYHRELHTPKTNQSTFPNDVSESEEMSSESIGNRHEVRIHRQMVRPVNGGQLP